MGELVRAGRDAFVTSVKPDKNFGTSARLRLRTGVKEAYLFLKSPVPAGATVEPSYLVLTTDTAFAGSATITVQRLAAGFRQGTITWNTKPAGTGATAALTIASPAAGALWMIDVSALLQEVANGAPLYGFKITSDTGSDLLLKSLNASSGKPYMDVAWVLPPEAPSGLVPDAGAVSVSHPTLSAVFGDVRGMGEVTGFQVQIDADADGTAVTFDSGMVSTTVPQLDLGGTAYAGLADNETTWWRCRVTTASGTSVWSDWAVLKRLAKGSLTIDNPGVGAVVDEFTPPIAWTLTGATQARFQVRITDAVTGARLWDSKPVTSAAASYTLPAGVLVDDRTYKVTLMVWDTETHLREETVDDPVYLVASRDFTVAYTAGVSAPATLTAAQDAAAPFVVLTWTRATMPDSWTIIRDGTAIEVDVDPADVFVSGTTYSWVDWTADPERAHTYRVRAEVNGELSTGGPTATITLSGVGMWLLDEDNATWVRLHTAGPANLAMGESAETLTPLNGDRVVRIVQGMRGLEGEVVGAMIRDWGGVAWSTFEERILAMKGSPSTTYRLVLGDRNLPVVLGAITVGPHPASMTGSVRKAVSFRFWQDGELPFEVTG